MKFILLFLILLFAMPGLAYETTLLTVSQESGEGGVASIALEIKPGSGRVFIDSYPVSRADTQFSTRYAKEVACDFLQANCERYDFFYTIRTQSSIVGGPSAGAAIAMLTIAGLDGEKPNANVAMTGTINSGGVIGPVAGVLAKVDAARNAGITTVLVPQLAPLMNLSANNSLNQTDEEILANLSRNGFQVIQANDLYEALPYFIDKEYPAPEGFTVPPSYTEIMQQVSDDLCSRHEALMNDVINASNESRENAMAAKERGEYYAAASFCFSDSIRLQRLILANATNDELQLRLQDVEQRIFRLDTELKSRNLSTIADIETYAIVRERLLEARQELLELNASNISSTRLAYVIERTNSAYTWSDFFAMESKEYSINERYLEEACFQKIAEAEERITYIDGILPESFAQNIREDLQIARADYNSAEYAVCLFKASKTKAEANLLASVISVRESRLPLLAEEKLNAVERVIARQADRGLFPIMGYSYLEYGSSLVESEPYSALTFAEYALEVSNLHLYFPPEEEFYVEINWSLIFAFFAGLFLGLLALVLRR